MKQGIRDWGLGIGSARQRRRPDRAGYALVLFLMVFFGLMGLAALVIDLGFARLAQRQMQCAVDSAALEGLRFRSECPGDWLNDPALGGPAPSRPTTPYDEADPLWQQWLTWLDGARRESASRMITTVFDDDFDATSGDSRQFGAGPVVAFSGGIGPPELAAAQTMVLSDSRVYKPHRADGTPGVEANRSNDGQGDLVAGTYCRNASYDSGSVQRADEDAEYDRRDFTPASAASLSAPAFLARMRRTNDFGGMDTEAGVSSGGPTLPFLFGRGSLISGVPGQQYSPRQHGITVRAGAIAVADDGVQFDGVSYSVGRAKAAGPPYQGPDPNNPANQIGVPGITPFALTRDFWEQGPWVQDSANSPQCHVTLTVTSTGGLVSVGAVEGAPSLGQVMDPTLTQIGQQPTAAGNDVPLTDVAADNDKRTLSRYVPVYESLGIVGFGYVQWGWDAASRALTLTKGSAGTRPVGCGNVSGVLVVELPKDGNGNVTVDVARLFASHAEFGSPLYSPVLANHYIGPTH